MHQLLYISSARTVACPIDLDALLLKAQRNNLRDGVTGLLFTDGKRFLQAIEGPTPAVESTFLRITADTRHHGLVLLSRRETPDREFGDWSMARRGLNEAHNGFLDRIAELCRDAAPSVRGTFAGLIEARRAA